VRTRFVLYLNRELAACRSILLVWHAQSMC